MLKPSFKPASAPDHQGRWSSCLRRLQHALILGAVLGAAACGVCSTHQFWALSCIVMQPDLSTSYQPRSCRGSMCVLVSAGLCGGMQSLVKSDR
jgi:hypothetical protein